MKSRLKLIIISALLLCNIHFAYAANTGVEQLKHFLTRSDSFSAAFSQSLFDEKGYELQFSAGQFSLQKPGKFSWDYEEPYRQVIMSNGKLIWLFDSELDQVTIKPVESSLSKTSMVLLFNKTDIEKDFKLLKMDVIKGVSWIELIARDHDAEFSNIFVGMKNNLINSIKMIDGFGQTTVIQFSKISSAVKFKPGRFEFAIPKNADVIGGE
ncbi:MAG: outer membrane lipoprotein chaperone LolA [Gammaproteobacteria bacterium]|nr:outer membrane lipoprotein chaperone LolA [Gammaproteobacteria bacterium]